MADTTVSYQTLLEQCALKQPTALQHLYDLEASHLLALGISLLYRPSDAEELMRESFGLIWRNADAYDPNLGSARAWIYSIFRFKALQRLKQSPTLSPFNKTKARFIIPSTAPSSLLPFQRLDEKARHMLGLAYLHAYSFAEIAKECQSTIKQTQYHLNNALLVLTQVFKGWKNENKEDLTVLGLYCLGLLRDPQQLNEAQSLLSNNPDAAHDLLLWEEHLSALTHTLATPSLPSYLLARIYQDLGLQAIPKPVVPPLSSTSAQNTTRSASLNAVLNKSSVEMLNKEPASPTSSADFEVPLKEKPEKNKIPEKVEQTVKAERAKEKKLWHNLYWLIALVIIIISALLIWAFMPKAPIVQRIEMTPRAGAVLLAPGQSSTPGWIATVDPEGHVLLTPQVTTEVQTGKAVQLWTQSPTNPQMRSLGLLNPNQPVTVPKELIGEVQVGQIFEMTLEPSQGSATPSGAVLFIGRIVNFGEFEPAENAAPSATSDTSAI